MHAVHTTVMQPSLDIFKHRLELSDNYMFELRRGSRSILWAGLRVLAVTKGYSVIDIPSGRQKQTPFSDCWHNRQLVAYICLNFSLRLTRRQRASPFKNVDIEREKG